MDDTQVIQDLDRSVTDLISEMKSNTDASNTNSSSITESIYALISVMKDNIEATEDGTEATEDGTDATNANAGSGDGSGGSDSGGSDGSEGDAATVGFISTLSSQMTAVVTQFGTGLATAIEFSADTSETGIEAAHGAMSGVLDSATAGLSKLGPHGQAAAAALQVVGGVALALAGYMMEAYKATNALAASGFRAEGGMFGVMRTANAMGLSLTEMGGLLNDNNALFKQMGSEGLADFSNQLSSIRSSGELQSLGMNAKESATYLASYYEQQRQQGNFEAKNFKKNKKGAVAYIKQLDGMAQSLSMTRAQLDEGLKKAKSEGDVAALSAQLQEKLGQGSTDALLASLQQMNLGENEVADMMNYALNGTVGDSLAPLMNTLPGFAKIANNIRDGVAKGNVTTKSIFKDADKHTKELEKTRNRYANSQLNDEAKMAHRILTGIKAVGKSSVKRSQGATHGLMAQIDTMISTFFKSFKNFFANIFSSLESGKSFGDALSGAFTKFTNSILGLFGIDMKAYDGDFSDMIGTMLSDMYKGLGSFVSSIPEMLPSPGEFTSMLMTLGQSVGDILAQALGGLLSGIWTVITETDWGMVVGQVVSFMARIPATLLSFIGGFVTGIIKQFTGDETDGIIDSYFDKVIAGISEFFDIIPTAFNALIENVSNFASGIIDSISALFTDGFSIDGVLGVLSAFNPIPLISNFLSTIYDSFSGAFASMGGLLMDIGSYVIDSIAGLFSFDLDFGAVLDNFTSMATNAISSLLSIDIGGMISGVGDSISSTFSDLFDFDIGGMLSGAGDSISSAFGGLFDFDIGGMLSGAGDSISSAFGGLFDFDIGGMLSGAGDSISSAFGGLFDFDIGGMLSGFGKSISSAISSLFSFDFSGIFGSATDDISDGSDSMLSSVADGLWSIFTFVPNLIKGFVKFFYDQFTDVFDSVTNAISKSFSFDSVIAVLESLNPVSIILDAFNEIEDLIDETFDINIGIILSDFGNSMLESITSMFSFDFAGLFSSTGDDISDSATSMFDFDIGGMISGFGSSILSAFTGLFSFDFSGIFSSAGESISSSATSMFDFDLVGMIGGFGSSISSAFTSLFSFDFFGVFSSAEEEVKEGATSMFDFDVKGILGSIGGVLGGALGSVSSLMSEGAAGLVDMLPGKEVFDSIGENLSGAMSYVGDLFSSKDEASDTQIAESDISSAQSELMSTLISPLKGVIDGLSGGFDWITGIIKDDKPSDPLSASDLTQLHASLNTKLSEPFHYMDMIAGEYGEIMTDAVEDPMTNMFLTISDTLTTAFASIGNEATKLASNLPKPNTTTSGSSTGASSDPMTGSESATKIASMFGNKSEIPGQYTGSVGKNAKRTNKVKMSNKNTKAQSKEQIAKAKKITESKKKNKEKLETVKSDAGSDGKVTSDELLKEQIAQQSVIIELLYQQLYSLNEVSTNTASVGGSY